MEDMAQKLNTDANLLDSKYPKAGTRWNNDENDFLISEYKNCLNQNKNFEEFLLAMAEKLGRRPNGIRGRLALTFPDIPGWDYQGMKQRDEDRKRQKEAEIKQAMDPETDKLLISEYNKYVSGKLETFRKLGLRLAEITGKSAHIIRARIKQLIPDAVEYKKEDVENYFVPKEKSRQPEVINLDLSTNDEMAEAFRLMEETRENIFLTGEAGTGKSTLLRYFKDSTHKNSVVLAPTGVAAINVGGQTVHSFCGFGPDITVHKVKKATSWGGKKELLQKLSVIIIDEISMVRADLLDCVDKFLRLNGPNQYLPFGGVQMIFVGDLYQLPPVEKDFSTGGLFAEYQSPYFFDAHSFAKGNFKLLELKTVYRQKDRAFLEILNAVRNNAATSEHLEILNSRNTEEAGKFTFEEFAVYLTPTNARATQINEYFLSRLPGEEKVFLGFASGKLEDKAPPAEAALRLKANAQIMMLNNDPRKRWVNGTMGKVLGFVKASEEGEPEKETLEEEVTYEYEEPVQQYNLLIKVELETGEIVFVGKHTWEMFNFYLDKRTEKVESRTVGKFTQYPLKPAWALTIHKSQGKTFDKVYVDLAGGTFAHGQLYVALSRCRTLEGLHLRRPVILGDIKLDTRIVHFLNTLNS